MILYFLRHASAGEPVSNLKKDEKRALDETGVEQCGYVGRALAALDVQVDVIISSPLKRAAQTASLVGNEMGYEGKLQLEDALRPTASFADFRKMLDKYIRHDAIMVVGHNPTMAMLASGLAEGDGSTAAHECLADGFPTSSLAVLRYSGPWRGLDYGTAELLRCHVSRG